MDYAISVFIVSIIFSSLITCLVLVIKNQQKKRQEYFINLRDSISDGVFLALKNFNDEEE